MGQKLLSRIGSETNDYNIDIASIFFKKLQISLINNQIFLMVQIETNPLYYAAVGGLIIGLSTSIHYILKGNVTGMSGIVFGIASLDQNDMHNKLSIVGGMFIASAIFFDIFQYGTYNKFTPFGPADQITEYTSYLGYALAGLLVGFGTKMGNGCTSGHGLCGLARLSIRSFVAIIVFLISAISIGTIRYYLKLGPFTSEQLNPQLTYNHLLGANIILMSGVVLVVLAMLIQSRNFSEKTIGQVIRENLISFLVGFIFAVGLIVSGMCRRRNILQFLWMGQDWNPSLLFVLGCGVIVNLIVFQYMIRVKKVPYFGEKLFNPNNNKIDWKLILGGVCFGLGWGIGGLCPGPAIALFAVFNLQIHVVWFGCLLIGMLLAHKLNQWTIAQAAISELQQQGQQLQRKQNQDSISKMQVESVIQPSRFHLKGQVEHHEGILSPIHKKKAVQKIEIPEETREKQGSNGQQGQLFQPTNRKNRENSVKQKRFNDVQFVEIKQEEQNLP